MKTQLEDGICLMSGLFLHVQQSVDIIGIEHYRFLTDHISAEPQSETYKRIVRMIGVQIDV